MPSCHTGSVKMPQAVANHQGTSAGEFLAITGSVKMPQAVANHQGTSAGEFLAITDTAKTEDNKSCMPRP